MKAAIISIGNELLGGFSLDSNSTWIGRKLMDLGIRTTFKMSVRDSREDIVEALGIAGEKADLIICTGGLGPTNDDVTKEAFCDFMGANLKFDKEYYGELVEKFDRRGLEIPDSNQVQAYIPDRGSVIPNPKGSALGIMFEKDETRYYVLPGVPMEMKTMMEEIVLPNLQGIVTQSLSVHTIRTTGIMESALYDLLSDLVQTSEIEVSFLPGFMGVDLRLTHTDPDAVTEFMSAVYDRAGDYVYGEDWETLEEVVGKLLRENNVTVAAAESCTGGLLTDRLTNVPGSSDYVLGGVVTYSNEAKISILEVKKKTLEAEGAVSEETARQMAQGVRDRFQAQMGISTTGIAGPGGATQEKPVGLTYIGLDFSGKRQVKRFIFSENRRFNKELAAQAALNMLRLAI
ncbi:MAG: competence/damage-inducible protein A [Candidatus Neomarinimicrobiota bacterium]